jgi:hypothetical protein
MPKLKVTLSIGFANAKREDIIDICETEWSECKTDEEREKLMDGYWDDWSCNYINGGVEIVNE